MARRKTKRFAGTDAQHTSHAASTMKRARTIIKHVQRSLDTGNCTSAFRSLERLSYADGSVHTDRAWTATYRKSRKMFSPIVKAIDRLGEKFVKQCIKNRR